MKEIINSLYEKDESELIDFFSNENKIDYDFFYQNHPFIIHVIKARKFKLFDFLLNYKKEINFNGKDKYNNNLIIYIIRMDKGVDEYRKINYIKKLIRLKIDIFQNDLFEYNSLMESASFDKFPLVFQFLLEYYFKNNKEEFIKKSSKIKSITKNNKNSFLYEKFVNKNNFIDNCY